MHAMKTTRAAAPSILICLLSALLLGLGYEPPSRADDRYVPKPPIPSGFRLVGGDILLPLRFALPKSPFSPQGNRRWTNGIVPYEFDPNVAATNQAGILVAMAKWQAVTAVQFVLRNAEDDYVHIQNSTANNSSIGRLGGEQYININDWAHTFVMAHELGHCLGFGHTQSRSDRDQYIAVNYANIQAGEFKSGKSQDFDIQVGFTDYGPYDFDSVMEYGQCDFSIDCPVGVACACTNHVIDVLPPNDVIWQSRIGQRDHLSQFDKIIMSFLYPQSNWRFLDSSFTGTPQNGTFLNPYIAFVDAEAGVPSEGTLWIQPGNYHALGTHSNPMIIQAPLGGVTLGN